MSRGWGCGSMGSDAQDGPPCRARSGPAGAGTQIEAPALTSLTSALADWELGHSSLFSDSGEC